MRAWYRCQNIEAQPTQFYIYMVAVVQYTHKRNPIVSAEICVRERREGVNRYMNYTYEFFVLKVCALGERACVYSSVRVCVLLHTFVHSLCVSFQFSKTHVIRRPDCECSASFSVRESTAAGA